MSITLSSSGLTSQTITKPFERPLTTESERIIALGVVDMDFTIKDSKFQFNIEVDKTKNSQASFQFTIAISLQTPLYPIKLRYLAVDPNFPAYLAPFYLSLVFFY